MSDKPMIFNGDMVRALLDGRKVQTRRPIKIQPPDNKYTLSKLIDTTDSECRRHIGCHFWQHVDGSTVIDSSLEYFKSPFGYIGDLIWLRETFSKAKTCNDFTLFYKATDGNSIQRGLSYSEREKNWRPSIHMPRWASRLTLKITNVRVERLQDITEDNAASEGIEVFNEDGNLWYSGWMDGGDSWFSDPWKWHCNNPVQAFKELWDGIYFKSGKGWNDNPWVWCYTLEVIHQNIDDVIK